MQILITHGSMARARVLHFNRVQLALAGAALAALLMLLSGAIYHFVFLKAAREGWPVVSQIVRLVVRDEFAQRDRFMRENLDAMAQKVGQVQAKLVKLEAMGERVAGLAGVKTEELKLLRSSAGEKAASPEEPATGRSAMGQSAKPGGQGGQGGPFVSLDSPSLERLTAVVEALDQSVDQNTDVVTLAESRLRESRMRQLLVPSSQPVDTHVGSGFGFRSDPFTGRPALHTGLDFPAELGTTISAAAGGIVVTKEVHPSYGNVVEIDHGNGLITRYAHCSSIDVEKGALVRQGQAIAKVGSTGRSTGPHLHFEVLLEGSHQDPARFLAGRMNSR